MEHLLIKEAEYAEQMKRTVVPYLDERREERYLERETGNRIYCVKYQSDTPRGVIVISHGYTETAEKYWEIVYYFLKKGYHVYLPEHCGHGYSYRLTGDLSLVHTDKYQRYVEDFRWVSQTAKKENQGLPLFLYGHSMGGGIGSVVLAEAPELFSRAVLSSPMFQPLTGAVPWTVAKVIAAVCCKIGKENCYVAGNHKYEGQERFEDSASASRARFDYYNEKRMTEPLFQMNGASYGWLHAAIELSGVIRKSVWKKIRVPVLVFQAEQDAFVSGKAQERFVRKLSELHPGMASLIRVPGTRHEMFNADETSLKFYWEKVFEFLGEE